MRKRLIKPITVLIATLCLTAGIMSLVVWNMSKGPDFSGINITYVQDEISDSALWQIGLSAAGESGGSDASGAGTTGEPPGSADMPQVRPRMSDSEKLEAIEKKYTVLYNGLKTVYLKELDRMIKHAKNDYEAIRSGKREVSVSGLVIEYMRAGRALESNCDGKFNSLLKEMKNELIINNLPLDLADQAEKEYNDQKSRARKDILTKVARFTE